MLYSINKNRVLETLASGKMALGFQLRSLSPRVAELAGFLGFDYLYIETEHFACSDESVETMVRAAQMSDITPWVRVTDCSAENIGHMLDIGVKGVIVPHLDTPEMAKAFVDAVKYPPIGHRGNSASSRAAYYGCVDAKEYLKDANRVCSAIGMIESVRAVENLDEILSCGIDLIRIGMGDLSLDMGIPGQKKSPEFEKVVKHILEVAHKHNVPVGCSSTSVEEALYYQAMGFDFLTVISDMDYLFRTLKDYIVDVRKAVDGE